jgi:RNA recognition motif-containing protein
LRLQPDSLHPVKITQASRPSVIFISISPDPRVMKIYVGNLSFDTDEATLRDTFAEHGSVDEVAVISDRDTGRPRGFAFVTMSSDAEAQNAINALNGKELAGRTLKVSESRPRPAGGRGGGRDRGGW